MGSNSRPSTQTIHIPSIIAQEAYYFEDENLARQSINLEQQISAGVVNETSVSAADLAIFNLLRQSGVTKKLEPKHTTAYFDKWLGEGQVMRIQGAGLKSDA